MALWTVHFCIHQRKPWLSQSWSGDAGISGNNPPFNGRMSAEKVYAYYCQQFSSNKVVADFNALLSMDCLECKEWMTEIHKISGMISWKNTRFCPYKGISPICGQWNYYHILHQQI
jgi:hypothetical protein